MKTAITLLALTTAAGLSAPAVDHGEPPVIAPFVKGEDSLCVNDWWNRPEPKKGKDKIIELKVPRDQVVAFGLYTVSNNTLKLSARCQFVN